MAATTDGETGNRPALVHSATMAEATSISIGGAFLRHGSTVVMDPPVVGDAVLVGNQQLRGIVKFIGTTTFASGEWMGVELEDALGKNDGCVKGERYFDSKPNHGLFVRPSMVTRAPAASLPAAPIPEKVASAAPTTPVAVPSPEKTTGTAAAKPKAKSVRSSTTSTFLEVDAKKTVKTVASVPPPAPLTSQDASESPTSSSPQPTKRNGKEADETDVHSPTEEVHKIAHKDVAKAKEKLQRAVEDHDAQAIAAALPEATKVGVSQIELSLAQRTLNFEVQKSLLLEMEGVRSAVAMLSATVQKAETQANFPKKPEEGHAPEEWLKSVGKRLEERVWQGLELRLDQAIQSAVASATQLLVSSVRSAGAPQRRSPAYGPLSQRWRQAVRKVQLMNKASARFHVGTRGSFSAEKVVGELEVSLAEDEEFEKLMARWGERGGPKRMCTVQALEIDSLGVDRRKSIEMTSASPQRPAGSRPVSSFLRPFARAGSMLSEDLSMASSALPTGRKDVIVENRPEETHASTASQTAQAARASVTMLLQRASMVLPRESAVKPLVSAVLPVESAVTPAAYDEAAHLTVRLALEGAAKKLKAKASEKKLANANSEKSSPSQEAMLVVTMLLGAASRRAIANRADGARIEHLSSKAAGEDLVSEIHKSRARMEAAMKRTEEKASCTLQAAMRGQIVRKQVQREREGVKKLQAAVRNWKVRRTRSPADKVAIVVGMAMERHRFGMNIFLDACKGDMKNKEALVLGAEEFAPAFHKLHRGLTKAQVDALWKGFVNGAHRETMDASAFCQIAAAVSEGPRQSAEVADVNLALWNQLGEVDAEVLPEAEAEAPESVADEGPEACVAAMRAAASRMQDLLTNAQAHNTGALSRIQARVRGNMCRQDLAKQAESASRLQRAVRLCQARWKAKPADKMAAVVALAAARHKNWIQHFRGALGHYKQQEVFALDEIGFALAMSRAQPQLSLRQIATLWKGNVNGTGITQLDALGFCGIADAVSRSEYIAAEVADMGLEKWRLLGQEGALAGDAAGRLAIFLEEVSCTVGLTGARHGLSEIAFKKAMRRSASPRLADAQVMAFWLHFFQKHSSSQTPEVSPTTMGYEHFCGLLEALSEAAEGAEQFEERLALEFAGAGVEDWRQLGNSAEAEAITKLQAAERGRQVRAATSSGQRQKPLGNCKLQEGERGVHARLSVTVISKERKEEAVVKIQKITRGNIERATCQRAKAELSSAKTLQRIWRDMMFARGKRQGQGASFVTAVRLLAVKNQAWVRAFKAAAGDSRPEDGLESEGFFTALSAVHPRLTLAQLSALFEAYEEGCDERRIDIRTFCKVAQAVAAGDEEASEFADITVRQWQDLGKAEPYRGKSQMSEEKAATLMQAAERGRQVRVGQRAGNGAV